MKQGLSVLFLIILIVLIMPICAAADGVSLRCTAETADAGNYVVSVEASGTEGVEMMQFLLRYDPEKLSCTGAEIGSIFRGNLAPTINRKNPGEIALSWDSLTPLPDEGTVLRLNMRLLTAEATLSIDSGEDLVIARDDFAPLEVVCEGYTLRSASVPEETALTEAATPAVSTEHAEESPPPSLAPEALLTVPAAPSSAGDAPEESGKTAALEETVRGDIASGLTILETQPVIKPGENVELKVAEKGISLFWTSTDENVAAVDETGVVTAYEEGTVVITVSNVDGTAHATRTVTVSRDADRLKADLQSPQPEAEAGKENERQPELIPEEPREPKTNAEPVAEPTPPSQQTNVIAAKQENYTVSLVICGCVVLGIVLVLLKRQRKP